MNPYEYAKNFFSNDYLAQQVTWEFGLLLLSLVAVIAGLVLIRRAFGEPTRSTKGAPPPPGLASVERYELMARFWHWSLFGMMLALGISGAAFYAPGSIPGPVPILGLSWQFVHLAFGVLFTIGILSHSIHGFASHLDPRTVWFDRHDWQEIKASARYYLGMRHELPKLGKFGAWNKVFHTTIVILALLMVVTGISLSLGTLGWVDIDQDWQRKQRLLHDFGSYGFLALIAAHIFWQLLKKRRPQLKSIVIGKIPVDTYSANHDWDRWEPDVVTPASDEDKG